MRDQCNGSQSVVPGPAASESPGNLLEMQHCGAHSRPTESETLGLEPINLCSSKSASGFWCTLIFEDHWLSNTPPLIFITLLEIQFLNSFSPAGEPNCLDVGLSVPACTPEWFLKHRTERHRHAKINFPEPTPCFTYIKPSELPGTLHWISKVNLTCIEDKSIGRDQRV